MQTGQYEDPILEKVLDLIDHNNQDVKGFFQGDPLLIPRSSLPAIIASKDTTNIADVSSGEDEHIMGVVLTLVVDVRDTINDVSGLGASWTQLYDMFEGRGSDYILKAKSIIDILRGNANLTQNAHIDTTNPMIIDYGLTVGKRGERSIAVEGNVSFNVYFSQLR